MAYMQLHYRNSSAQLTPQETYYIRREAAARQHDILAATRSLRRIIDGLDTTTDIRQVLARFSASVNTARIPKRFTTETPSVRVTTARSKQHDRLFYRETHNRNYTRRLRRQHCRQRKASMIEDHYFQVPTTPLPQSYAAQQDSERARGSHGRRRGHTASGYAPLFTKSSTSPLASRELSPMEQEALKFLTPSKQSPKAKSLERLEAQAHYTPSDPKARILFNEPKRMPDLHRRVPVDFKAECVDKPTTSFEHHCEGNGERAKQNAATKGVTTWH